MVQISIFYISNMGSPSRTSFLNPFSIYSQKLRISSNMIIILYQMPQKFFDFVLKDGKFHYNFNFEILEFERLFHPKSQICTEINFLNFCWIFELRIQYLVEIWLKNYKYFFKLQRYKAPKFFVFDIVYFGMFRASFIIAYKCVLNM